MEIFWFIGLGVLIFIGAAILGGYLNAKRKAALREKAAELGLTYVDGKHPELAREFDWVEALRKGSRRYGFDLMLGKPSEWEVKIFSYHYQVQSSTSEGGSTVTHYYLSVFSMALPVAVPELRIFPEDVLSKVAQALGYEDIDFESHEFSKKFCVRSKDKKFAYAVCHPQMMEWMLGRPDLNMEMEGAHLALICSGKLTAQKVEPNLRRLLELRERMPDYLWEMLK
ncbi:MAG: hypothetical protein HC904_06235 [Blastochloris sp.]|nr:hypothetical protein [Blastochloris sp.]